MLKLTLYHLVCPLTTSTNTWHAHAQAELSFFLFENGQKSLSPFLSTEESDLDWTSTVLNTEEDKVS